MKKPVGGDYQNILAEIANAKDTGATELSLNVPQLQCLPNGLCELTALQKLRLNCAWLLKDLSQLSSLTALQTLVLGRAQDFCWTLI
ncbi:MAG: hypothetical protein WC782_05535 [Methylococcaceae bacterium]|jgi:hypothetical protein